MNFEHKKIIINLFIISRINTTIPSIYRKLVDMLGEKTPEYEEILELLYNELPEIVKEEEKLEIFKIPYTVVSTKEYRKELKQRLDNNYDIAFAYKSEAKEEYRAILDAKKIYIKSKQMLENELEEIRKTYESLIKNGAK